MHTLSTSQRSLIFLELAAFAVFAIASKALLSVVAWRYAGPLSLLIVLFVLTLYMRSRGRSWAEFGLKPLPGIKAKLMLFPQASLTFLAFIAVVAPIILAGEYFELTFLTDVPEGIEDRWGNIEGNLPLYLLWLGIVWTCAAFGEEMFFRGYLVTRLHEGFSGSKLAPILAILMAAVFFGYGHMYYQGWRGFLLTGMIAIAFGTMFLIFKRSLWPMIIVHGCIDTLTFTVQYLGLE